MEGTPDDCLTIHDFIKKKGREGRVDRKRIVYSHN